MRKDHFSPPSKWTKEFRRALKLSHAHHAVYAYLEGGLESHATGVFFVTLSTVAEMVVADRETVARIMTDLERIGLILWDRAADVVYVPCVCAEQFRWNRKSEIAKDFRLIEARRHIESLPQSQLVELFLTRWPIFCPDDWTGKGATQAPTQGATQAPAQAPNTTTCTSPSPIPPRGAFHEKPTSVFDHWDDADDRPLAIKLPMTDPVTGLDLPAAGGAA